MSLCLDCFILNLIAHEIVCEQIPLLRLSLLLNVSKTKGQLDLFINKQERAFSLCLVYLLP